MEYMNIDLDREIKRIAEIRGQQKTATGMIMADGIYNDLVEMKKRRDEEYALEQANSFLSMASDMEDAAWQETHTHMAANGLTINFNPSEVSEAILAKLDALEDKIGGK